MKRFVWCVLLIVTTLPFWGQSITLKESSILEGDNVSSISEITLTFDFSDAATETGKSVEELGIASTLLNREAYRLLVYKGGKDSEYIGTNQSTTNDFIVGSGFYTISKAAVEAGNHSITIPLSSPITLDPGELYTIYIPKGKLMAGIPGTLYTKTATTEPIIIEILGATPVGNELKLISSNPSSEEEVDILSNILLSFNQNIQLADPIEIVVSCNGEKYAVSTNAICNESQLNVYFDDIKLLKDKNYIVTIPANSILSSDGTQSMDAISLFYKGGAYQYMNTGRVYPSVNNPVSWLSTVKIPFVFPEGYNIGKVESANVRLYEGSMESEPTTLSLGESNDLNSLTVDVWKFDLKPNTTYYVVLDKEQIFPARSDDYRIKLKDTTNDDVILAYTTPAEEEMLHPEQVSVAIVPEEGENNDRLDVVTFNLPDYEFENASYLVQVLTENPVAIFNDGTNETTLPLKFNASGKNATCAINRPLEEGKTYTIKVPAGTFAPNANANLAAVAANEELVFTFVGKAAPVVEFVSLSYTVDGEVTFKTMVEKGKPVSIAVTVPEGRQIESVTLDGSPLSGEMDVYTIPALAEDAGVLVTLVPVVEPDPVYYNVTLSLDNAAAQTSAVEEGKSVSFMLTPADDLWMVESVENATLDETSGLYVTEPVSADLEVKALLALVNPIDFDFTTGVDGIETECRYRVYSEESHLVVEGVTEGDNIRVYTVGGSLMADKTVPAGMDIVSMSLSNGIYIIAINGTTIKVRH